MRSDEELLEILSKALEEDGRRMTYQSYPPCVCGSQKIVEHEYAPHPDRKGLMAKVLLCKCGRKIYPAIQPLC